MEINICTLYPERLNLNSDLGNVKILKYRAEARGINVILHEISLNDKFDKDLYDITVICGGNDTDSAIAVADILNCKKDDITEYIENQNVFLAFGNGFHILGKYYLDLNANSTEGAGILPFYIKPDKQRHTGNCVLEIDGEKNIGFENHVGKIYTNELQPLGKMIVGYGNNGEDGGEGIKYKNTICTNLHGPFLASNPKIADEIIKTVINKKYNEEKLLPLNDEYENAARNIMIKKSKIKI